ncbi:hypothetical protein KAR91_06370 [Candidatus Pacearchaeota archaeon]|nr:hypothetical protein [Candidatus Pacearchaeota archaeon]
MPKVCSRRATCVHPDGPILLLDEFHKNKNTKDGRKHICKACRKIDESKSYFKNREVISDKAVEYRQSNREVLKKRKKNYYEQNKEAIAKRTKLYRDKNKENIRLADKLYRENNKDKVYYNKAKYRASKLLRTVQWSDEWVVKQYYILSKKLSNIYNEKFVVDHTIPLQGKNVSGLHVHNNLQIITEKENLKKSNKFEPIYGV